MKFYTDIIIEPLLTEKVNNLKQKNNIFTCKVAFQANKTMVKEAIEKLFEVKVEKVNICNVKPSKKRMGQFLGKTSGYKKAYVKLAPGYAIGSDQQAYNKSKIDKKGKK